MLLVATIGCGKLEQDRKGVIQNFYQAMESQDYDKLKDMMAEGYQIIDIGSLSSHQKATHSEVGNDIVERAKFLNAAFPNFKIKINEMVAEGNQIVVQADLKGNQRGNFLGVEPTNTPVVIKSFMMFTLHEDKIIRAVELWNELGVMKTMDYIVLE